MKLLITTLFFLLSLSLTSQSIELTGVILDSDNLSVPGVSVRVSDTGSGTISDVNGLFKLTIDKELTTHNLMFSFIGFTTQSRSIGNKRVFNITLSEDVQMLDDFVKVGYGSAKKTDLAGAVSSVRVSALRNITVSSVDQLLAGKVAGVVLTQNSGAPGSAMSVRIRGGNSIASSNEPLYVIDGIPFLNDADANSPDTGNESDASGGTNPLSSINPSDISNIEVLKDASATAIYGSRGANGVIIITTKNGQTGNTKFNFNASYGVQSITRKIPMLNALEFAALSNESRGEAGEPKYYTGLWRSNNFTYPDIKDIESGEWDVDTDWQDQIFRIAPIYNLNLSLSGGTDKTKYYLSGNHFNQDGILIGSNYNKTTVRLNLDQKGNDVFSFGTNINLSRYENSQVPTASNSSDVSGAVRNALVSNPVLPVYNADGSYFSSGDEVAINHPIAFAEDILSLYTNTSAYASFYGFLRFGKHLTLKSVLGGSYLAGIKDTYYPRTTWLGDAEGGRAALSNINKFVTLSENYLTYDKVFFNSHKVNFVVGNTFQNTDYRTSSNVVSTFPNDILENRDLGSAALLRAPNNSHMEYGLVSVYGRLRYSLLDKYLLTLTYRRDGSTKFSENNKWSGFPSCGIGWRISEEKFIKNMNVFNNLKLRTSYGLSGSQAIKPYQTRSRLGSSGYYMDGKYTVGYGPGNYVWGEGYTGLANADLTWETTKQFNAGLDISFFKPMLTITLDYYKKNTFDLLQPVELPKEMGFSTVYKNLGQIQNEGYELDINLVPVNQGFVWEISGNFALNRNKVVDLGSVGGVAFDEILEPKLSSDGVFNYSGHILKVGEPLGSFYGYVTDGIIQTYDDAASSGLSGDMAQPGEIKYVDTDKSGTVDASDRQIIGNANPLFTYGFSNTLRYKGFEFSVFFQGVKGGDVLNLTLRDVENVAGYINQSKRVLDRWTPDHPSNTMPKARLGRSYWMSDRYIQDGSFLRLKNVKLSYSIPVRRFPTLYNHISSLQFYLSGSNLYTWTKYFGYDPETNAFSTNNMTPGVDSGNYPNSKTISFGVNMKF